MPINNVGLFLGDDDDTMGLTSIGGDTERAADLELWIFRPLPGTRLRLPSKRT